MAIRPQGLRSISPSALPTENLFFEVARGDSEGCPLRGRGGLPNGARAKHCLATIKQGCRSDFQNPVLYFTFSSHHFFCFLVSNRFWISFIVLRYSRSTGDNSSTVFPLYFSYSSLALFIAASWLMLPAPIKAPSP